MDNTNAAAYHQLGRCYIRLGNYDEAIGILEQVVNGRPQMTPARLDLGVALVLADRPDDAREQFNNVLAQDGTNGRAMLGLAQVSFHEGDWGGAMGNAHGAISFGGENFAALYMLGRAARLAEDIITSDNALEKADKLLERSIENSPNKPEGYFLRGEVYFTKEHFADALEHYEKAENTAEEGKIYTAFGEHFDYYEIMAKRGLCYQRLGQLDRARDIGQKITAKKPDHRMGKALAELPEG